MPTPLRLAYLLCIGIATLLQLGFDPSLPNALSRLQRALDPTLSFRDVVDAARNIALFVGWGATWVLTSRSPDVARRCGPRDALRHGRQRRRRERTIFSRVPHGKHRGRGHEHARLADRRRSRSGSPRRRATTDLQRGTLIGIPGWIAGSALLMSAAGLTFAPSSRPTLGDRRGAQHRWRGPDSSPRRRASPCRGWR